MAIYIDIWPVLPIGDGVLPTFKVLVDFIPFQSAVIFADLLSSFKILIYLVAKLWWIRIIEIPDSRSASCSTIVGTRLV